MPREFGPNESLNPKKIFDNESPEDNSIGEVAITTGETTNGLTPSPYVSSLLEVYRTAFESGFQQEAMCFYRDSEQGVTALSSFLGRNLLRSGYGKTFKPTHLGINERNNDYSLEEIIEFCLELKNSKKGPKHFAGNEELRDFLVNSELPVVISDNAVEVKLKAGNVKFRFAVKKRTQI